MARPRKYSDVFPALINPVHIGVYQRKSPSFGWMFSKWDGEKWLSNVCTIVGGDNVDFADRQTKRTIFNNLKWRGLANKP